MAAAVLVGASLAACSSTDSGGDSSLLEQLQDEGVVTVGFAGEAPYSFEENGQLTGATVALHREIFGNLGIETVEGVNADFGALIPGLQANRFDVVSAGMSILPERCEQASFSDPEFNYTTALMVPTGNPMNLTDMQSVAESGARLATMTGSSAPMIRTCSTPTTPNSRRSPPIRRSTCPSSVSSGSPKRSCPIQS